ncbi:hypothetical protein Gogos_021315 [Gossypium gossypioides]|uniref:IQ domain-containing protein IQM3-like n=1 Tax=Gossypium gossypioides TaxID=34282 RepID=A0A7J9CXQ7_GOSGO|nr:hypothetical protein [Gossypium gossypioides]
MEVIECGTRTAVSNFDMQSKSLFYDISSRDNLHNNGFGLGSKSSHFFSMDSSKEANKPDSASGNSDGGFEMLVESSGSNHSPGVGCYHSNAAVKVQKVYRSYWTRRRIADSAVIMQGLITAQSPFFNYSKPESVASRWNRVVLNASKVGKGLFKDAKAQKLAFRHWIEAIDPRHRYGHNLHIYYDEWCKSDAGQPFFYWLDIGEGKEIDLQECPRSKLRQQCIKEHYEYIVFEGKIIHKQTGNVLHTIKGSEGRKWIFVVSTSKKLYAGEKKKGMFHHSSFLAGGATFAAGRLVAEQGILKSISAYSGHYRPTDDSLENFLSFLKEKGVNLSEVEIRRASDDSDNHDNDKSGSGGTAVEVSVPIEPEINSEEKNVSPQSSETNQTGASYTYKRTLSCGLQSPTVEVPKKAILQRINSKKAVKSYQLGHRLSLKWSTGAGPRIGCIADYPVELRQEALEFVNLSPRTPHTPSPFMSPHTPSTPSSYRHLGDLPQATAPSTSNDH